MSRFPRDEIPFGRSRHRLQVGIRWRTCFCSETIIEGNWNLSQGMPIRCRPGFVDVPYDDSTGLKGSSALPTVPTGWPVRDDR
jgi:hypothetical protein